MTLLKTLMLGERKINQSKQSYKLPVRLEISIPTILTTVFCLEHLTHPYKLREQLSFCPSSTQHCRPKPSRKSDILLHLKWTGSIMRAFSRPYNSYSGSHGNEVTLAFIKYWEQSCLTNRSVHWMVTSFISSPLVRKLPLICASEKRQRLSFIFAYTSSLKWEERGFCYLEGLTEMR